MLDALPLPLVFGGLGVIALLVGVVVIWTRGRGSGDKAFAEFEADASPQQAAESSTPPFEPLPPAPQESPEPMVVANFAPDQLSLGLTVLPGRRRPGASMKSFKEMAGSVVTKG